MTENVPPSLPADFQEGSDLSIYSQYHPPIGH